ncbi:tetratricopeptide repeat-containing glycosyltransferase family 2 protein [Labrys miyagiensis]|nr:glycosyltransferase [Labrys miyagiensis]
MIARDEAVFLPGCLESIRPAVDEIIVVDTGSSDETREIARSWGAVVIDHRWNDDFAAARNVALDAALGEWLLYVDADERLVSSHQTRILDCFDATSALAAFVQFKPKSGYTRYREPRLFRNRPDLRFTGPIHETIVPALDVIMAQEPLGIVSSPIRLDHLGYDGDQSRKHSRNLPLLLQAVRDQPGRVYYWAHLAETFAALGKGAAAIEAAKTGLVVGRRAETDKQKADTSLLFQFLARAALDKNPLAAMVLIHEGLARYPSDYALTFLKGRGLCLTGSYEDALFIFRQLLEVEVDGLVDELIAFDGRIFGEFSAHLAGVCLMKMGRQSEATAMFRAAIGMSLRSVS